MRPWGAQGGAGGAAGAATASAGAALCVVKGYPLASLILTFAVVQYEGSAGGSQFPFEVFTVSLLKFSFVDVII